MYYSDVCIDMCMYAIFESMHHIFEKHPCLRHRLPWAVAPTQRPRLLAELAAQ